MDKKSDTEGVPGPSIDASMTARHWWREDGSMLLPGEKGGSTVFEISFWDGGRYVGHPETTVFECVDDLVASPWDERRSRFVAEHCARLGSVLRRIASGLEMVAAAESKGIHLVVCHQMRFSDEFVSAKLAVDRGSIGTPYLYRASSFGHLMEQGPHMVDMILWLAGNPEVEWVMGQIADVETGRSSVHPAPAFVLGYVAFAGGARAILECGRSSQRAIELPDETWLQKRVQVLGTDGVIDSIVAHHCKIMSPSQADWKTLAKGDASWNRATAAFYEELRDVINDGGIHRNGGAVSLRGFEIIHAIYAAALARDRIEISPDFDKTALEEIMASGPER